MSESKSEGATPASWRGSVAFIALTALMSCPWWWLISVRGGFGVYYTFLMWTPGIAALLTVAMFGGSLRSLGFVARHGWLHLAAAIAPVCYIGTAFALAWTGGFERLESGETVEEFAADLGFASASGISVIVAYALITGVAGVVRATTNALGEEIGWRGFLFPNLVGRFGFVGATLTTGAIWVLWHFPLPLLRADFSLTAESVTGLAGFSLTLLLSSFVYSYFRLRTGSVWTAALIHGAHNALLGTFGRLTAETEHAGPVYYYVGEEGVLTVACAGAVALVACGLYYRDQAAGRLALSKPESI